MLDYFAKLQKTQEIRTALRIDSLPPRSFSLIVHIHALVEPFLHFVKKIGTAVVLAQFEV